MQKRSVSVSSTFRVRETGKDKYQWIYELHLLKNPVVFFTLIKIFLWICLIPAGIIFFSVPGSFFDKIIFAGKILLAIWCFMFVLLGFSYLVYALMTGWKYIVIFEMNNTAITHTQLPAQKKKAEKIGVAAALVGALAGQPGATSAGVLAAAGHGAVRSDFKKVRKMRVQRRLNTIKLRTSDMMNNQIYVHPDDFDFVLQFISSRVSIKGEKSCV